MEDVREVSEELHRLAESEPAAPLDTDQLLQRGRRGVRRRRLLGAGGAVAGVAVVALAASLLPNLTSADGGPEVAAARTQNPGFEPVPGVPSGEDGADQRISKAEATQRCALRYPDETNPLRGGDTMRSGHPALYDVKTGVPRQHFMCLVPGGDKPSKALAAAAAKDPLPRSMADKLRNCSVAAWIDVTDWQVVASDESKAMQQAEIVAVSPSGTKVVDCRLSSRKDSVGELAAGTTFATLTKLGSDDPVLDPADKSPRTDMYAAGGGSAGGCEAGTCPGYQMNGWGRVASKAATTVRLQIGTGPAYTVPVGKGGWFAFTWRSDNSYPMKLQPKVAAYDRNGKLVKTFR
jgi:hypothetical protein